MSALRDLQQRFKAHVLAGDAAISTQVAGHDAADSDERLGVYRHAYRQRLREVLGEDFLGLRALADGATFAELSDAYIDAHPSRHPNIRWFGASMATWLANTPSAVPSASLVAMAELDWAISTCFDAANHAVIGSNELIALTAQQWPTLRLRMNPTVQRLQLSWNVDALRIAIDNDQAPPALQAENAFTLAVWRKDFGVRHRRLDDDEAAAYAAAVDGANFSELCELLCQWQAIDAVAMRAVELLQRWVAAGWIANLDVDSSP